MGHTHSPEIDLDNRYVNTGRIEYGYASYLHIDNGNLEFVQTTY